MKIINCQQGSPEWNAARAGVFTASEFDSLVTPTWKRREGETPQTYIVRKVAERVLGYTLGDASSFAMEMGQILEKEAIPWFQLTHDVEVQRVGFILSDDGGSGCSPDGLIGEDGGIEIKCMQAVHHTKCLLNGGIPPIYLAQVYGGLYVTQRKFWNFLAYHQHLPKLLVRVERDEQIIAKIDEAIQAAREDFDEKLVRVLALKEIEDAPLKAAQMREQASMEAKARAANGGEAPGEKWARERDARV